MKSFYVSKNTISMPAWMKTRKNKVNPGKSYKQYLIESYGYERMKQIHRCIHCKKI